MFTAKRLYLTALALAVFASSSEFVGRFEHREVAEGVKQAYWGHFVASVTMRFSGDAIIHGLDGPARIRHLRKGIAMHSSLGHAPCAPFRAPNPFVFSAFLSVQCCGDRHAVLSSPASGLLSQSRQRPAGCFLIRHFHPQILAKTPFSDCSRS